MFVLIARAARVLYASGLMRPLAVGAAGWVGVVVARDNDLRAPAVVGAALAVATIATALRERGAALAAIGVAATRSVRGTGGPRTAAGCQRSGRRVPAGGGRRTARALGRRRRRIDRRSGVGRLGDRGCVRPESTRRGGWRGGGSFRRRDVVPAPVRRVANTGGRGWPRGRGCSCAGPATVGSARRAPLGHHERRARRGCGIWGVCGGCPGPGAAVAALSVEPTRASTSFGASTVGRRAESFRDFPRSRARGEVTNRNRVWFRPAKPVGGNFGTRRLTRRRESLASRSHAGAPHQEAPSASELGVALSPDSVPVRAARLHRGRRGAVRAVAGSAA